MITTCRSLAILITVLFSLSTMMAQTPSRPISPSSLPETPATTQTPTPIITATASTDRVRYIAAGEVHQTRLQVFSPEGAQVYDSGLRLGNLIDWRLVTQQGTPPVDGTYLYLVTVKEFSDRLTQKYGTAVLDQGQVYLEHGARTDLSQAQGLALESNRLAEALSPVDRIGTAGLNRTTTSSDDVTPTTNQPTSGTDTTDAAPGGENIGGTGSQNRIAKWVDNSGNLGDSIMFDNGSGVGVGTTDLTDVLVAGNDKLKVVDGAMTFSFRDFSSGQGYFAIGSATNGIKGFVGHTNTTDGFTLGSFSNHKLTIRTNSINRLTIDTTGNVGIGTITPTSRLDVAGNINTSTQYNIGGGRVLSVPGTRNIFAGVEAGETNVSGVDNAYFGNRAGQDNGGSGNAYFGSSAGRQGSGGNNNSFFGYYAGVISNGDEHAFFGAESGFGDISGLGNTLVGFGTNVGIQNLSNATAIGHKAFVTRNNSLVLGSINGVNGAGASVNVGIGTTAPGAKLHVAGGSIFIAQPNSLIITSPNGACWFITVNNTGGLATISVPCP